MAQDLQKRVAHSNCRAFQKRVRFAGNLRHFNGRDMIGSDFSMEEKAMLLKTFFDPSFLKQCR
jgi:hypothetical protein